MTHKSYKSLPFAGESFPRGRRDFRGRKRNVALRVLLGFITSAVFAVLGFFIAALITEYRPKSEELIYCSDTPVPLSDTVRVLSWNIGYAGLGDNMDFFYDGGRKVRDSQQRTCENLWHILNTIRETDADIILLQEVDIRSKRTYGINELDSLKAYFPEYEAYFACNYKSLFVPIPLREPIGRVESGLVILTRFNPMQVKRLQYPSGFSFPSRLFNLKRGMLTAEFLTASGDTVVITNTHNTAYDTGNMRTQEMDYLSRWFSGLDTSGTRHITGGDWNQYPPDYQPSDAELSNPHFTPARIDSTKFSDFGRFAYDTLNPSLRYLDRPLSAGPVQTLTDFFFVSFGLNVLSIETIPENYKASDHNPVVVELVFQGE